MAENVYKKLKKVSLKFHNFRAKLVVRAWNLAKHLDPKQIVRDKKKKGK